MELIESATLLIELATIFLLYVFPLYIANATPIIVHGKTQLDLGLKIFGKPILGKGKTIIGTLAGITAGTLAGAIIALIFPYVLIVIPNYFGLALFLSTGAILGDITKSFFKRRFGIKSGQQWVLADQLDFIVGGLIVSTFFRIPEVWLVLVLLVATFFIHSASNYVAFKLKLKKVPW
ncbi:MAG: CDP-2,3-bis-(O-geranylgeranyl)-sn-glycerol synthase [archaeon]|jgi:CDP-2,3-bis-(O-geranylgeranyl)-sn-glycerol synthase